MRMNRRNFLLSAAAAHAGLWLSPVARAAGSAGRRFVIVFAHGGWDVTRVFADEFDNRQVDMEPGAERWRTGGLSLVDHPGRPSVRTFFERWSDRTAVLNGLLVPSVAHETCQQIVMTGGTRGNPDWGALIAGVDANAYVLPNLVLDAPSFPAQFGLAVARAGADGQLDGLVDGSLLEADDHDLPLPSRDVRGAVDRYLLRRAAAVEGTGRTPAETQLLARWADATRRAVDLEDARYATQFGGGSDVAGKIDVVVEALSKGLSRCVSMTYPNPYFTWDTHNDNDAGQSPLWEGLFAGLVDLQERLDTTAGPTGRPLAEDTVVVVVSEMARTPKLNGDAGKDHWPYTSALLFGSGVRGGTQVGDFNHLFQGTEVDLASGEVTPRGVVPSASHLGATLVALADEDPAAWVSGYAPIGAVLA
jgi:uncharacterized protein (DUF1501 family)